MINLLDNINDAGIILLVLCGYATARHLKKTKWQRKLSKGEMTLYFFTVLGIFLYAGSTLLLMIGT
ncbi:hypothetical protein [Solibacillus sp. CAU 1738]|uniref:hypothetical protein n=1 Tax=Solibacillus sp. CAU 1738 TaxID=3140363 RepID=UPI003260C99B